MEACKYISNNAVCNLAVTSEAWLSPLSHHKPFRIHFCDIHIDEMKRLQENIFDTEHEAQAYQVTRSLCDDSIT